MSAEDGRPRATSRSWQLEPGAELGPWRVVEPLGAGGMGEVYVAEHAWLPTRRAAIKVLRLERADTGRVAGRFRAEAALLASIDHPNVVRLYDAQITEDERAWMAMGLVAIGAAAATVALFAGDGGDEGGGEETDVGLAPMAEAGVAGLSVRGRF